MKFRIFLLSAVTGILVTSYAQAQESNPSHLLRVPAYILQQQAQAQSAPTIPPITNDAALDSAIRMLQHEWAHIKYAVKDEGQQEAQMEKLAAKAASISAQYPTYAEPKIWQAIILSTQAGIKGGLGALGLAKEAKTLLETAEKINANALHGSIYTSLGSLYYKVPGWPLGFGDDDKALAYLEQARALNPDGIDPNYFYGDYLIEQGKYKEALTVLRHALNAPDRPDRADADAGRRAEIRDAIAKAKSKLKG